MLSLRDIRNGVLVSLWFVFLTFPLLVIKVNPIERIVTWRWQNMLYIGGASFVLYMASRAFLKHKHARLERISRGPAKENIE